MASITTRAGKGSPLTHAEVDANFNNLNNDKLDIGSAPANSITVASSGRVGIGTSSPQARLEVQAPGTSRSYTSSVLDFSNIHLNGITPSAATSALTFTSGGGGGAAVAFSRGGSVDTEISFWTNSVGGANAATQRMVIDSSGRLLVGTSSARSIGTQSWVIQNEGTSFGTTGISTVRNSNDIYGSYVVLGKSRGASVGSSTIVQNNDGIGGLIFAGADGTDLDSFVAQIDAFIDGAPGANDMPGRLVFSTTPAGASFPTERMRINSSGSVLIGTSASRGGRSEFVSGTLNINADYSGSAASFVGPGLVGTSANRATVSVEDNSAMAIGVGGSIGFGGRYLSASAAYAQWAAVAGKKETGTSGEYGGYLGFYTRTHNTNAIDERMRIDSNGDVLVGTTTVRARLTLEKAFAGGTAIDTNTTTASTTYSAAAFRHNGTLVGQITASTTATAYVTSSDYRLKENIEPVADGITRLKQLNPSRFNFIADPDTTVDGFIAHEVQAVVPEAITGEKDAEDDDGNPIYQGIDQSKLVPLLTAALQEAIAKIETLEAKVAALEAG